MAKKTTQTETKETNTHIKELEARIAELEEAHARARADYSNLEKRVAEKHIQFINITKASFISGFVGIFDNLEMAAKHLNDPGLDMVLTQIGQLLTDEGTTQIEPKGKTFDPKNMECVETVIGKKDEVVEVVQKGYQIGDHLIRPAKVHVGNGENEEQKN